MTQVSYGALDYLRKHFLKSVENVKLSNCSLGVAPGQPSNFQTGSIGTNSVSLSWSAPTEEADHIESYELYWDDNLKRVFLKLFVINRARIWRVPRPSLLIA